MRTFLGVFLLAAVIAVCTSNTVTTSEWEAYKLAYSKTYATTAAENNARYYYAVNKDKINTHNTRKANGLETYTLAVNQYSDLRFLEFAALFPPTTEIPSNGAAFTAPTTAPQASFSYADLGFTSPVQNQEQVCNSGWAHAAAAAIGIYSANIVGVPSNAPLSPQNFIDCAGGSKACTNQVSQVAFDYLTKYAQKVFPLSEYGYTVDFGQGMCILPANQVNGKTLTSYSTISNGNDVLLKTIVNYVAPVVIKFNPGSFEFMHYKAGIFTQPAPTQAAAHYMTVTGYGTDTVTGKDYWLVQNSFGTTWGEAGLIRIERSAVKPIANAAIFPSL